MRLLLATHSSNSEYNAECDYAILDLTKELARAILKRIVLVSKLKKDDPDLCRMSFWDYSARFIACGTIEDEDFMEGFDDRVELPEGFDTNTSWFKQQRTDMDRMFVDEDSVYWESIPKHTDIYVETRALPVDLIRQVAEM